MRIASLRLFRAAAFATAVALAGTTVLVGVSATSAPAHALELTQRQVAVDGKLMVGGAKKIAAKLVQFDTLANAPIYLTITATGGSAQGVMLVADTIRAIKSPVVAVVQTNVHGAGAALAAFADRVEVYPSAGFVFTDIEYEGVAKPKPPPEPKPAAEGDKKAPEPKQPEPGEVLLQKARADFLDGFWGALAKRVRLSNKDLVERIEAGGFVATAKDAVKAGWADAQVTALSYRALPSVKGEVKTVTTLKEVRTTDGAPAPGAAASRAAQMVSP